MTNRKIILFELNEVPYRIIDQYCQDNPYSSLSRILSSSRQYETWAEDTGTLAPTKTWPTLHRGVTKEKHGISSFGQSLDEIDKEFPPIWQLTTDNGVKTGVFGSLLSYQMPKKLENYAFFVPEVFAKENTAHPHYITPFQEFNLTMSRASARNVSQKIDWDSIKRLIPKLPQLGLTVPTFLDIGKQLANEKLNPKVKTRRRTFQTVLGFDVFLKQLAIFQPDFATFFTNNVAATMHRYWAAAFPGDYDDFQLRDEWVASFRHEINFAMTKADALLSKLITFVNRYPEYLLLVASSMGQAAFQAKHTGAFLTIKNLPKFMNKLGLEPDEFEQRPAMAPHFSAVVAPHKLEEFRQRASKLKINGHNVIFKEKEDTFFHIDFNYQDYQGESYMELDGMIVPFEDMGVVNRIHEDGVYLTADHIPQGILLVYHPQNSPQSHQRIQISTLDITPSILNNFSIPIPAYMNKPFDLICT
ncbi:MAG TPA: hypothetical protein DEG17_10105 [Cyanobacteria bacterium UBA11149]|nr:hypothetical protein [Cyanobacteria bacterium UBA11367]HBE58989.1 hypothetical protein [Cyanobacteria bacterium UBA11366]HBK63017.1 hypothetical protein [Cyanobacteria bacterium UBA11166]HBR76756.1 hypothetical protein [Cyanobacteria bacterium UBA11159]HBS70382.1 hypothetical protein [Cyanobacteria bacterium UBA11153]HBW89201.1 hypothetical protein [Cyanobacteria bacterium UBA11149]HCA97158.1 hypothetical protein [Cyanobacteria bacterium UBA9226]